MGQNSAMLSMSMAIAQREACRSLNRRPEVDEWVRDLMVVEDFLHQQPGFSTVRIEFKPGSPPATSADDQRFDDGLARQRGQHQQRKEHSGSDEAAADDEPDRGNDPDPWRPL